MPSATTPTTTPARQAQFVMHLMLGKLLDPPVQPHEQEVFDELACDVAAAAKAKQGREVMPDDTEGGMWPFGEGGLESDEGGEGE